MKTHARVVIIGGGVAGCSTLYHLTKFGWTDVVLVDKDELTSGSTWLAAGNVPQYAATFNNTKIHNYPVELYPTLEEETGQHTGWTRTGSLRIALTPERMLEYRHTADKDKILGINSYMVGPSELKDIYPFIVPDGVLGGLFHPEDGHVDPAGVTQALAKGAKNRGAEIYRFTPVTGISRTPGGEWIVHTEKGDITCEYVVNCAGLWAMVVGRMVGLDLPIVPTEHQHILFGDVPELVDSGIKLPLLRCPDSSYYMRQEMNGLLIGPYELDARVWKQQGPPMDFSSTSLPPDLDRINDYLMSAINRVPILEKVGVQHEVNGPVTYSADANPMVGPAFGLPNFFINAAHPFGITECGTYGRLCAEWIIHGEPSFDIGFADPRRFGDYTNDKYNYDKVVQAYQTMFSIPFPNEERPAARNIKMSPIHDLLEKAGASFGQTYGWERANWFAPQGMEPQDELSYKRTNWFEAVGKECLAVRNGVGLLDLSGFAKYEVSGPGAEEFLDYLCANRLPQEIGQMRVSHMLNRQGGFRCDTTITRLDEDRFYVVSAAAAESHDLDWMVKQMPQDGSVDIEVITTQLGALVLSGPKSREVLAKLTEADLSNQGFPFMTAQEITVGYCRTLALRIGFVGELGWELHCPIENTRSIYQALMAAGQEFGITNYGLRALNSLRMEKGYLVLGGEISHERTPIEAGLNKLVALNKGDFMGRQVLVNQVENGTAQKLCLISVATTDADCIGDEPVFKDGKVVGRVTSGAYGHAVGKSLCQAYIDMDATPVGTKLEIGVFGQVYPAVVEPSPLYDPENKNLRA